MDSVSTAINIALSKWSSFQNYSMILCVIEAIHKGHAHEEGVVRQNMRQNAYKSTQVEGAFSYADCKAL